MESSYFSMLREGKDQLSNSANSMNDKIISLLDIIDISEGVDSSVIPANFSDAMITYEGLGVNFEHRWINELDHDLGKELVFIVKDGISSGVNAESHIADNVITLDTKVFANIENVQDKLKDLDVKSIISDLYNSVNINQAVAQISEKIMDNGEILKEEAFSIIDSCNLYAEDKVALKDLFIDGITSITPSSMCNKLMNIYASFKQGVVNENDEFVLDTTRANVKGFKATLVSLPYIGSITNIVSTALLLIPSGFLKLIGIATGALLPIIGNVISYPVTPTYNGNRLHNLLDAPIMISNLHREGAPEVLTPANSLYPWEPYFKKNPTAVVVNFKYLPISICSYSKKNGDTSDQYGDQYSNAYLSMLYNPSKFRDHFNSLDITDDSSDADRKYITIRSMNAVMSSIISGNQERINVMSGEVELMSPNCKANTICFNLMILLWVLKLCPHGFIDSSTGSYYNFHIWKDNIFISGDPNPALNSIGRVFYAGIYAMNDPESNMGLNCMEDVSKVVNYLQDNCNVTSAETYNYSNEGTFFLNTAYSLIFDAVMLGHGYSITSNTTEREVNRQYNMIKGQCAWSLPEYSRTAVIQALVLVGSIVVIGTATFIGVKAMLKKPAFRKRLDRKAKLDSLAQSYQSDPSDENFNALYKATKSYNFQAKLFGWQTYDPVNNWYNDPSSGESSPQNPVLTVQLENILKRITG